MQQIDATPRHNGDTRKLLENLHAYAGIVRRGWRLIVIGMVISLTVAIIHVARLKTTYRAWARLLVIQQAGRPLQGAVNYDPFQNTHDSNDSLATHLMLIRSPVIVEKAIALSGLNHVSTSAVIKELTAKQPDEEARIVELTYQSIEQDEAKRVVEAVILSYDHFLKDNLQKNTNGVISLIIKARDELNKELKSLEKEYLEYRQNNPAYSADEKGRSFIVRRLDQWDQAMNQMLARSLQLKSQLELGRKLAGEGLDQDTITDALNQLAGMGGSPQVTRLAQGGTQIATGKSIDKLREELAEVESQRLSAEFLLTHLRQELADLASSEGVSDREIAQAFYADPEVANLQAERRKKQAKLENVQRLSRLPDDPALVTVRQQMKDLDEDLARLWRHRKPIIAESLTRDSNPEITATIRKAEADLVSLKAKKAALSQHLSQVTSEQLRRLRQDREQLGRIQGVDHPQVRQIEQQIAHIERGKDEPAVRRAGEGRTDVLLDSIARSLESIEAMRNDIQKKFEEDLSASKKTEIGQLGEANLRSNLDRQRTLFNSVVDQLKQAQLVSDFGSVSARTINPTEVVPQRPNYVFIIAIALVVGCGFGTLGAYVIDLLDARVRTVAEMRDLLNLPVIGLIPQLSSEQHGATQRVGLLSHETPRCALAESYRSIRTSLESLRRDRLAQVLLVSSPQPGDGKSTTASNLAITLAHAGRRVLLIDGDLRNPSLHVIYGLSSEKGLADALGGSHPIKHLARPTLIKNLDLLTTGSAVSNPAELLASPRLGNLLNKIRSSYDIIIIDSSPLLAVTDPSIIAAVADGIVLVVRVASTRRDDVERTTELLITMGLPVLGLVINGITHSQLNYGYGYGSGEYGYGNSRREGAIDAPEPAGTGPTAHHVATSHGRNGRNGFVSGIYESG